MNSNFDSSKIIKRRSFLAIIIAFLFFLIISVRLFFLQIIRGDTYKKKSKENRISTKITPPSRGDIFDTSGLLVAGTISNYSFVVYKYLNKNYDFEIKQFSKIIKPVNYDLLKDKLSKSNSYKPFFLLKNISWNTIVDFEKNKFRFSSIKILETKKRYYPHKNFSQIIGYMSDSQTSLNAFPKGAFHIEKSYNDTLKGFPGKTFNEVNAYGKIVRQISLEPSIKGSDLHLTINSKLQNFCQDIIPVYKKGSVVVLNSQDGSILALNSNPTFNSQDFENRDSDKISSFLNDENKPLFNRAFSGFYPPGSVFKPLPALLGLEKGLINETTEFFCKGYSSIGSRNYYCWKKGGHGNVNLKKGIKESCDVYFYELAKSINIDDLSSLATEMGFNQKYSIGLSNAKPGLVPNKKWKRKTYDESWFPGETLITTIGQGANQVSPLQLATFYSSIINGGVYPKPRILKNQSIEFLGRKINENFHNILLNALNSVVNEAGGTANKLFRDNPSYIKIAGKTGTSQVVSIKESDREDDLYKEKQKEQLEKFKDHSVFVGYGPVDNPKYIASVIIENGGSGSSLAAPLAHEILNFAEKNNV
mgnify:FL=1